MSRFDPKAAAREIAAAHRNRTPFANLSGSLKPASIDDAYAAQEELRPLWEPEKGPVAGLKIATTTKVMQALMGIDHPCGGMIYEKTIWSSPATLDPAAHIHPVIECELAVRLGKDLPDTGAAYTREDVRAAVGTAMAAFEIIEDRNAVYRETEATTLIADNAWNAAIAIGAERTVPADRNLDGIAGTVKISGKASATGRTDDPMGALAWIANLAVQRGRPMHAGMVVITGSVVPTFAVTTGQQIRFGLEDIGDVELTVA